jgi:hypothetical protein
MSDTVAVPRWLVLVSVVVAIAAGLVAIWQWWSIPSERLATDVRFGPLPLPPSVHADSLSPDSALTRAEVEFLMGPRKRGSLDSLDREDCGREVRNAVRDRVRTILRDARPSVAGYIRVAFESMDRSDSAA